MQRLGGKLVATNRDGGLRHELTDRQGPQIGMRLVMSRQIAVGEDAAQFAIAIDDGRGAGAALGHFFQHLEHGGVGAGHRELGGFAHDLVDPGEQNAAETAPGVETGKVVLLESARLKQNHGQGITKREHGRGAGGRGQIERAGFLAHRDIEHDVGGLAEGGVGAAGHGDEFHVKTGQRWEDIEEFRCLPAVAEGEDDVAIGDQTEVTVEGVERVEDDRSGPRAGQGGGNFVADVAGFAHAADHDLAALVDARLEGFDGAAEGIAVEILGQAAQFIRLDADDTACFGEVIHE